MGIDDVGVEALGRRLLVQALFEAGDLRSAEVEVSRFERASARLGRSEYLWYPPLWRASLALARGQMQARARARAQLEAIVAEVRGTNAVLLAGLQQGMMALDLADPNLASQSLQPVRVMEAIDDVRVQVIAALLRAFAGDLDEARESLDRCADAALAAELDSAWPSLMMNLAQLMVAVGGHPAAKAVRHGIEPYGALWVVTGIGAAIRGPLDRRAGLARRPRRRSGTPPTPTSPPPTTQRYGRVPSWWPPSSIIRPDRRSATALASTAPRTCGVGWVRPVGSRRSMR